MSRNKLKSKDLTYYTFQIIRNPVKWYLKRKLNINVIKNEAENDEGPFFITGNHVTAFDPIIALAYVKPLVKWVAADANLDNRIKHFFFKIARVIPITKRYSDVRTIKRLLAEVKAGNAVGLYPEGGRTWHGETDELIRSTAKLIKLLGIKVYCQKLSGAYVSSPRWGKNIYKGRIDVEIYQMMSEEEVKNATDEEIFALLQVNLYHNDYDYQKTQMVRLKGKDRAEYIERLVYACPNCHKLHTFSSSGDEFTCKACNAKGKINEYGFIEGDFPFDNLVDWYHFQRTFLLDYLDKNPLEPIILNEVIYKRITEEKKEELLVNLLIGSDCITIENDNYQQKVQYHELSEVSLTFKNTLIFYENKNRHELVIEPFLHNDASIVYIKEIINYLRRN